MCIQGQLQTTERQNSAVENWQYRGQKANNNLTIKNKMTSYDQLSVYNHKRVGSKDNIYKRKLWQAMESHLEINHLLMKNKEIKLYPWYKNTYVIDIKSMTYINLSLYWYL